GSRVIHGSLLKREFRAWLQTMLNQVQALGLLEASKVSKKVKSRIRTGENNGDRQSGSEGSHQSEHFSFSEVGFVDHREDANSSRASTPRGDVMQSPFGIFSHGEERSHGKSLKESADNSEGKSIHKIITSRAEAWIQKKTMAWPWKANDQERSEAKDVRVAVPFFSNDHQEN
ncbi:hypothetical protein HN51_047357, partial [Arachis hypogaea]